MRRVLGLMLIIRAFAPFFVLLIMAVAGLIILNDLRSALELPIEVIQTEIEDLQGVADDIREDIAAVEDTANDVIEALQIFDLSVIIPDIPLDISIPNLSIPDVNVRVPDVPDGIDVSFDSINVAGVNLYYPDGISVAMTNLSLDMPSIPAFDIPIPGLSALDDALRAALAPLTEIFDVFDPAFVAIADLNDSLQTVPDSFTAIADEGEAIIDGLKEVVRKWGRTLMIVFILLALLMINYFAAAFLDDVMRGWRMMRGLPAN